MTKLQRCADQVAKEQVGVLYKILALHVDRRKLKRSADWKGVIENFALALKNFPFESEWEIQHNQVPPPIPWLWRRRRRK
jgi:hypothetical protein